MDPQAWTRTRGSGSSSSSEWQHELKSDRHGYPRYPGDYARKTTHLSLVEHGAYALLMDWYYSNAKPLPDDWVQMAMDRIEFDKLIAETEVMIGAANWLSVEGKDRTLTKVLIDLNRLKPFHESNFNF